MPAVAPFMSTTGGSLTTVIVTVAVGLFEAFEPSLTTKLTRRFVEVAFWLVLR